jgi:protein-tyrosine-phosphatase
MKRGYFNILFVCKYNVLRSKIAETYFKKINQNSNIEVKSAGLIAGGSPLYDNEKRILKRYGFNFSKESNYLSKSLIDWADMIIIIANDIPKNIFMKKNSQFKKDIKIWRIKDSFAGASDKQIEKIITKIINKISKLVRKLSK